MEQRKIDVDTAVVFAHIGRYYSGSNEYLDNYAALLRVLIESNLPFEQRKQIMSCLDNMQDAWSKTSAEIDSLFDYASKIYEEKFPEEKDSV